jgi:outer membrane protein OmpA-like peptidoglycan-associated protein
MPSMVDSVVDVLTEGDVLTKLSALVGGDEEQTDAVASAGSAALIGGLAERAAQPDGPEAVSELLDRADATVLDDVEGFLDSGDADHGAAILDSVFGPDRSGLVDGLVSETGLDGDLVSRALPVLAPIVVATVARRRADDGLDQDGVAELLADEKAELESSGELGTWFAGIAAGGAAALSASDGLAAVADEASEAPGDLTDEAEDGDEAEEGEDLEEAVAAAGDEDAAATGNNDEEDDDDEEDDAAADDDDDRAADEDEDDDDEADDDDDEAEDDDDEADEDEADEDEADDDDEDEDDEDEDDEADEDDGDGGAVAAVGGDGEAEEVEVEAGAKAAAGGDERRRGLGWLWWVVAAVVVVLVLAFLLSQCEFDDEGSVATDEPATTAADEGEASAAADEEAEDATAEEEDDGAADDGAAEVDFEAAVAEVVGDAGVTFSIDGDVVTLSGSVESEQAMTGIEAAVAAIEGVGSIDNQMVVEAPEGDASSEEGAAEDGTEGETTEGEAAEGEAAEAGGQTLNEELGLAPITFGYLSSVIGPETAAQVDLVVDYLATNAEVNLRIEGHTDLDGPADKNLELSQRRADAVRTYLEGAGIDGARLEAVGLGETSPKVDPETSEDDKVMNRRIELIVSQ